MKDKEELQKASAIEEMAKDIHRVCTACSGEMFDEYTCDRCQAKLLIKKGYRKLPKDSVVLSREEYIDLSRNYVGEQVAQARKETAEKILDLLVPDCKVCDENWHSGCLCLRAKLAEKIAKQFGVERD